MADLNAVNARRDITYTGAFGSLSAAVYTYTFAAAQVADVALLGQIPENARVVGLILVNAALGGSTTLTLGYRKVNSGDTLAAEAAAFATDSDTNSPAGVAYYFTPIKNTVKTYLTATVGGAAATGAITVTLLYIFEGD
jgi:hypothetical protein